MNEEKLKAGDRVVITDVAFPNLPNHTRFIGQAGITERTYKTKETIKVRLDSGDARDCLPCFLRKETAEEILCKAFWSDTPKTKVENYYNVKGKKKWLTVGYFEDEPRDWPSKSKELVECAKFTSEGDAYLYANILARRPDACLWWAVVVR